jgi:hypothetical protein
LLLAFKRSLHLQGLFDRPVVSLQRTVHLLIEHCLQRVMVVVLPPLVTVMIPDAISLNMVAMFFEPFGLPFRLPETPLLNCVSRGGLQGRSLQEIEGLDHQLLAEPKGLKC